MESRELLDYYDEYSIRIAFLMLQGVYEQIMVARRAGNIGFENFVLYALTASEEETGKLAFQANVQGLSMSTQYIYILFRQEEAEEVIQNRRKEILDTFRKSGMSKYGQIAIIGENEGIFFIEVGENAVKDKTVILEYLNLFREKLLEQCPELKLEFGLSMEENTLAKLKQSVQKCKKALEMGKIIFPDNFVWEYEKLGPLAWLQIPEEELDQMLSKYRNLLNDEKNIELLRTLKVYLENNMNYSVTAEHMYVHINTIRKRIAKIEYLLDIDWENPIARMNTELLLNFLNL